MRFEAIKVGELARRTGLTVRTLHHYDEIGLLKPSLLTEARHRLYTAAYVSRLQQIISLRQLGFSLEEIRDCLGRSDFSPLEVIGLHVARLREQIEFRRQLCDRLDVIASHLRAAGEVSAEEFLHTIEVMTMMCTLLLCSSRPTGKGRGIDPPALRTRRLTPRSRHSSTLSATQGATGTG